MESKEVIKELYRALVAENKKKEDDERKRVERLAREKERAEQERLNPTPKTVKPTKSPSSSTNWLDEDTITF